jgi:integrase
MLKTLAKHHAPCSDADRVAIANLSRRLATAPAMGLTAKNRERLRPFEDPAVRRQLAILPARLTARVDGVRGLKAALVREDAMAIAILLHCPIRRRNLVNLHLERNLRSLRDGRVFLVYEASEVKNRRPIEFELLPSVVAMLKAHVATRSPLLCPPGTPWLFPRRDGAQPMDPSGLSNRISSCIRKETGLWVHAHLLRHLAAKIWLDERPGQYEALRRPLGHAELSSTLNAYAGFEAGTATREFARLIATVQESSS